ncbi:MAG: hypothetical protein ISS19_10120 [Bacteroidales bacterium]|nr:hypothetical protein [Bacteroidales bacterium]
MKKLLLTFIVSLFALGIYAQDSGFGIGVMAGEPTGISAKLWMSRSTAADFGVAWSIDSYLHVHGDFVMHKFDLINVSKGELPVYIGLGARILFTDPDLSIGVRVPVGLDYHFSSAPFDLFFELVPIMNLTPATEFDFNAAIGFRYFF